MGTVTKLNDVLCANISKVDDILKANASKWDDNEFCVSPTPTPTPSVTPTPTPTPGGVTPTPTVTPTITPTPTPTPSACAPDCCLAELCYSDRDCSAACQCNIQDFWYLHLPCGGSCDLANADGIFTEDMCTDPAKEGYYMQGGECYYWDGSSSLTYNGPC